MDSIQITIEANENEQEILISELNELGAEGFEQTDKSLIAYFNENLFRSYEVNELLKKHNFQIHNLKEQNWNELWETNFPPVIVGNFCAIRAEFHQPINKVEHEIIITPKMSFGTGHHATTYMMIEEMQHLDFRNNNVFDFGTGTGILSILAEKLGAASVSAIDVDEWSIKNAKENAQQNNCNRISVLQSSSLPDKKFDIILANINRNVILQYLDLLVTKLEKNGIILFSGLLKTDRSDIIKSCNELEFKLIKENERSNWIALLFVNRK